MIDSKYGSAWGCCSKEGRGIHGVGLWKNIRSGLRDFAIRVSFAIGEDSGVNF